MWNKGRTQERAMMERCVHRETYRSNGHCLSGGTKVQLRAEIFLANCAAVVSYENSPSLEVEWEKLNFERNVRSTEQIVKKPPHSV